MDEGDLSVGLSAGERRREHACARGLRAYRDRMMSTTVRAVYDGGVLKLRHLLPLPERSEVLVTVELPSETRDSMSETVKWPDISARLRQLYGADILGENAVLTARADERF